MASLLGFFPGLTPLSHDSVPIMISGFVYSTVVLNSAVLSFILLQLMVMILRFLLFGRLNIGSCIFVSVDLLELLSLCCLDVEVLIDLGLLVRSGLNVEIYESI